MIFWLTYFGSGSTSTDNCSQCIGRICCTVYSICSTTDQGRNSREIKKGGQACTRLTDEGDCSIYVNRENSAGYSENCAEFSCDNIGPILSSWIHEHRIDIFTHSVQIGLILKKLQAFVMQDSKNLKRYRFLETILLPNITSIAYLNNWCALSKNEMETQYQRGITLLK